MTTLEELRRKNQRLKNFEEARLEQIEIGKERARLKRENWNLENRKKVVFVKKVGSGLSSLGKALGRGAVNLGNQYVKAQESQRAPSKPIKKVKKVKRVKKVKKPSKQPKGLRIYFD